MPVLDATFLIDLQKRRGPARAVLQELHKSKEPLIVPAMAAAQYLAGSSNRLVALARLRRAFDVVAIGPNELVETARLAALSKERGRRPHWADLTIAATATLNGTYVLTSNVRDFQHVDVPARDPRTDRRKGAAG